MPLLSNVTYINFKALQAELDRKFLKMFEIKIISSSFNVNSNWRYLVNKLKKLTSVIGGVVAACSAYN